MPRCTTGLCITIALLAGGCGRRAAHPAAPTNTVVPSLVTLGLGKHAEFHAFLADPGVVWSVPGGAGRGAISRSGIYYAPLNPPGISTITIRAQAGSSSAEATVRLTSAPADSGDCLALGQSDAPGTYVYVDELPDPLVRVPPNYPDAAREAGVEGTVSVMAQVCACGEVADTRIVKSIPLLDAAAVAAVRQWIFIPALSNGEPVAVWVVIPVRFSLH